MLFVIIYTGLFDIVHPYLYYPSLCYSTASKFTSGLVWHVRWSRMLLQCFRSSMTSCTRPVKMFLCSEELWKFRSSKILARTKQYKSAGNQNCVHTMVLIGLVSGESHNTEKRKQDVMHDLLEFVRIESCDARKASGWKNINGGRFCETTVLYVRLYILLCLHSFAKMCISAEQMPTLRPAYFGTDWDAKVRKLSEMNEATKPCLIACVWIEHILLDQNLNGLLAIMLL